MADMTRREAINNLVRLAQEIQRNEPAALEGFINEIPDDALEEFYTALTAAQAAPRTGQHPDVSGLQRFAIEEATTQEGKLEAAKKILKGFDVIEMDGDIYAKRPDEDKYAPVDPSIGEAFAEGQLFTETLQDIAEEVPTAIGVGAATIPLGGLGAAVGMRAAAPIAAKVGSKLLPSLAGIGGNIAGSAVGGAAAETGRQAAGRKYGTIKDFSPGEIKEAAVAEGIGGMLQGVPNVPTKGVAAPISASPEVVQTALQKQYYKGQPYGTSPPIFSGWNLRPGKALLSKAAGKFSQYVYPNTLSPEAMALGKKHMPYIMKMQAMQQAGEVPLAYETRQIVSELTQGVKKRKSQLWEQLQERQKDLGEVAIDLGDYHATLRERIAKADARPVKGGGDDVQAAIDKAVFKQLFERVTINPEGVPWKEDFISLSFADAYATKQRLQDAAAALQKRAKGPNAKSYDKQLAAAYTEASRKVKGAIEDAAVATDLAIAQGPIVPGSNLVFEGPSFAQLNKQYSDLLDSEKALRMHGLIDEKILGDPNYAYKVTDPKFKPRLGRPQSRELQSAGSATRKLDSALARLAKIDSSPNLKREILNVEENLADAGIKANVLERAEGLKAARTWLDPKDRIRATLDEGIASQSPLTPVITALSLGAAPAIRNIGRRIASPVQQKKRMMAPYTHYDPTQAATPRGSISEFLKQAAERDVYSSGAESALLPYLDVSGIQKELEERQP